MSAGVMRVGRETVGVVRLETEGEVLAVVDLGGGAELVLTGWRTTTGQKHGARLEVRRPCEPRARMVHVPVGQLGAVIEALAAFEVAS